MKYSEGLEEMLRARWSWKGDPDWAGGQTYFSE